jgi:hypothetical protein
MRCVSADSNTVSQSNLMVGANTVEGAWCFGVSLSNFQENGLKGRACFVYGLEKTHPHVMCVVINDEQAVAKSMRGRDIDRAPNVA